VALGIEDKDGEAMHTDGTQQQLSPDYTAASQSASVTDVLAGSARGIRERQEAAAAAAEREDQERKERERELASQTRDLQRRVSAEYRSTLTRSERAGDRVRGLRRFRRPVLRVTVALATLAIVAAALGRVPIAPAVLGVLYLAGVLLASRLGRARAERLTPESEERVLEQLDRVKSALPAA
jgi:Flp pilus assembly protein TadB